MSNTNAMPIIRLEIESMRYAVMHALAEHQVEVSAIVDKHLHELVEKTDFEAIIKTEVEQVIEKAVKDYFSLHFEGGTVIYQTVIKTLNDMFLPQDASGAK